MGFKGQKFTDEQKLAFKEKRNKTLMERQGNLLNVEKVKQTKLERYGDENYNNQKKHEETCLERFGVTHHNKSEECRLKIRNAKLSLEVLEKYKSTMLERYGNENQILFQK